VLRSNSQDEDGAPHTVEDALADKANREKDEKKLPSQIAIMEPILRFLQLLCENHNRDLQVSVSCFHLFCFDRLCGRGVRVNDF
jgi:hypothetical protein